MKSKLFKTKLVIGLVLLLSFTNLGILNNLHKSLPTNTIQYETVPISSDTGDTGNYILQQYDFEMDTVGENPSGITLAVDEPVGSGTANVETLGDVQGNHVALHKEGGSDRIQLRDNFTYYGNSFQEGELHCKIYHDSSLFGILFQDSIGVIFRLDWWSGNLGRWSPQSVYTSYPLNQWVDVVIYFNLSLGWMFEIDGVRYGDGYTYPFEHAGSSGVDWVRWCSAFSGGGDGYMRVDDIIFKAEPQIKIVSPESKMYSGPSNGYYPATFGFESDSLGQVPRDWNEDNLIEFQNYNFEDNPLGQTPKGTTLAVDDDPASGTANIETLGDEQGNHVALHKVDGSQRIQLRDNFSYYGDSFQEGVLHCKIYHDSSLFGILFQDSLGVIFRLDWWSGNLGRWSPQSVYTTYPLNQWVDVVIYFDLAVGWMFEIDGVRFGDGYSYPFEHTGSEGVNWVRWCSAFSGGGDGYMRVDDVSFYSTSNNHHKFSLLSYHSFENDTVGQVPSDVELAVDNPAASGTANVENLGDDQQNHVALHKVDGSDRIQLRYNMSYYGETHEIGILRCKIYHDSSLFGILFQDSIGVVFRLDWWSGNLGRWSPQSVYTSYPLNQWVDVVIYFNLSIGWMFEIDGVRYGDGYTYPFEHTGSDGVNWVRWCSAFSGGGDGYMRVDDVSFDFISKFNLVHSNDFEMDTVGENPSDMTLAVDEDPGSGTANIENLGDVQQNHVALHKVDGSQRIQLRYNMSYYGQNYNAGILHCKIYHDSSLFGILFQDSMGVIFRLDWWSGNLGRWSPASIYTTYPLNQWVDVVIYFNLSIGWMFEIDGVRYGDGYAYPFEHTGSEGVDWVRWCSAFSGGGDGYMRIDDLSFSSTGAPLSSSARTVSEKNGHYNVLRIIDDQKGSQTRLTHDFEIAPDNGTIEFWAMINSVDNLLSIDFKNLSGNVVAGLAFYNDGYIKYRSPSGWQSLISYSAGTFYHIRLKFNCSSDTHSIWINSINVLSNASYQFATTEFSSMLISTLITEQGIDAFFDAIAFSWDPYYEIGQNMQEGILLSYTTSLELSQIAYLLDDQVKIPINGNKTIPMCSDGDHELQIYANDSIGKLILSNIVFFSLDTIAPEITVNSPLPDDTFEMLPPDFEVTIIESNLNTTWYTINAGANKITFSGTTGTIDYSAWNALPNGPVTLTFYANDSVGFIGSASVLVQKNVAAPIVVVNSPESDVFFGTTPPTFDLTITELNLNSTWYSLDGGITNITFSGDTGMIDQAKWDTLSSGSVSIYFYANDSFGLEGSAMVTVNKDTDSPTSSILFTPHSGTNTVNKTTLFSLIADDGTGCGVSSIKYRINSSSWTDYSNPFTLSAYSAGDYKIEYYAIDELGNQGMQNSITITLIDIKPQQPPVVPGFFPLLLIGAASIMILYYIRKIKKSN